MHTQTGQPRKHLLEHLDKLKLIFYQIRIDTTLKNIERTKLLKS